MTHDPVLHALADLCQWIEKNGMAGPASKPYESALKVLRDHVATSGEREYVSSGWTKANHREESLARAIHALPGTTWTFWIEVDGQMLKHEHVLPPYISPRSE